MDWFLYDNGLRHERVNDEKYTFLTKLYKRIPTIIPSFCFV